ncbi:hypothetical protein WJX81_002759 [Elliptochloris bilobata]|uniref:S5 DRBM domain-containing protein n=1 Tax=Elliptochloris bilobata TaxID=381761 RepID=A0AAW1RVG7_9CHLO
MPLQPYGADNPDRTDAPDGEDYRGIQGDPSDWEDREDLDEGEYAEGGEDALEPLSAEEEDGAASDAEAQDVGGDGSISGGSDDEAAEDTEDDDDMAVLPTDLAKTAAQLKRDWLAENRPRWPERVGKGTKWDIGDVWQLAPPRPKELLERERILDLPRALIINEIAKGLKGPSLDQKLKPDKHAATLMDKDEKEYFEAMADFHEEFDMQVIDVNVTNKGTRTGGIQSFTAMVVVGNYAGVLGLGVGRAKDMATSLVKAHEKAMQNFFYVPRYRGATLNQEVKYKYGGVLIKAWPLASGSGIRASKVMSGIARLAGLSDVGIKVHGSRCIRNAVKAVIRAFESQKTMKQVMDELQPPELGDQVPALRITELAANHFRSQDARLPTTGGSWFHAPKQVGKRRKRPAPPPPAAWKPAPGVCASEVWDDEDFDDLAALENDMIELYEEWDRPDDEEDSGAAGGARAEAQQAS